MNDVRAYNVRMTYIDTTLTTTGNSSAVRLPKEVLRMSGLSATSRVRLEARQGKIIISKSTNPREEWGSKIKSLIATEAEPTTEFEEMRTHTANDGLDNLLWDGPSFEEWQKANANLS